MGAGKGFLDNYPKRVGFILSNEFCERFSFYGMRAILVIFLTRALDFSESNGTAIYHGFNMACYFMPIFGAVIADGFLGHYKTIFIISIVYAIGNIVMASGAVPWDNGEYLTFLPFIGLILIAIGTGGIKPCVAAFGANQFEDHQVKQKQTFFSLFYMAINCGSLLSMIITPMIRSNIKCFGGECYPLAFGVPACLMIVAVCIFILGTPWYSIKPPGDNVIGKLFGCIFTSLKAKCCCSKNYERREHWLDYSDSKYDKKFIDDVKSVMRVLFMYIPLPVFYALFDQQGSRWVLQAGRLNGDLGGGFVLQPDQLSVINPVLVVTLVPLTETFLFPCLNKLKIPNRPLQRLGFGMTLAGTAFILSGFLQLAIDRSQPAVPSAGHAQIKLLNAAPCHVTTRIYDSQGDVMKFKLPIVQDGQLQVPELQDKPVGNYTFETSLDKCIGSTKSFQPFNNTFKLNSEGSYNIIFYWDKSTSQVRVQQAEQPLVERTQKGQARLQIFNTWEVAEQNVTVKGKTISSAYLMTSDAVKVYYEKYVVKADNISTELEAKAGAVYTGVLHYTSTDPNSDSRTISLFEDISPNSLPILLMLPQYFVMTSGEIFFSVTGLSFAYSQSPPAMKAVLQAAWLLNNSLGNCLVMVITAIGQLPSQMAEFFMFAGLMYVTVIIFSIMSMTYVYVEPEAHINLNKDDQDGSSFDEKDSGIVNAGLEADELPPKYDVVMDGEQPIDSTYM